MSRLVTTALLAVIVSACSTPSTPTQPSAAPRDRFPDLKAMAGTYTLTIDLDKNCSAFPATARHRVYQATLEDRGWHYLVVGIVGGGFAEPIQVGDLFSGELSPFQGYDPQIKWNDFEVREPLSDGSELAVCGWGPIARSASALSGAVKGYAFISRGTAIVTRCEGVHQFSFER